MELLGVSQAADVCIKEAMLSVYEVCSLHGAECAAEIANIDGRMPAVKKLCELLQWHNIPSIHAGCVRMPDLLLH